MNDKNHSWKKHMTAVRIKRGKGRDNKSSHPLRNNYSSYLPSVYTGLTNRTDRYMQYDQMDQDSEISTSLDILSEFCTQNAEDFEPPFLIHYKDNKMGDVEVTTLEDRLQSWMEINDFGTRIFDIFRNVLKYGDQFFIRDPETYEWLWVNPANVEKITVNESEGKKPILYFIKDLQLNLQDKVVSKNSVQTSSIAYPGALPNSLGAAGNTYGSSSGGSAYQNGNSSPFPSSAQQNSHAVLSEHMIHISRSTQMDAYWPFGSSILEDVFKTYKQKELLEDSIIIYRVQRAPERRVFKIDTGDMPEHLAMAYVERIKNEIHQRRIPTARGGSASLMDAAYNPMAILEDYFFPQTADGRGSDVTTLPGGDNLGQIDDLKWFNNKLIRGLKIPQSYLPFGPEDSGQVFNDGKIGTALIQEFRFNKYCQRLQATISKIFDKEFKKYLDDSGYQFNYKTFEVKFRPPLNFATYRKAELESTLINCYTGLNELPFIAKQTLLMKMGWSQDEIVKNEQLWMQENPTKAQPIKGSAVQTNKPDLTSVGIENPSMPDSPETETPDSESSPMSDQGAGDDLSGMGDLSSF